MHLCMYMYTCVALSGSLEWVLCCLDVTMSSVVSSLSRCCVLCLLSGAPRFMSESCEFGVLICYVCIK